MSLSNVSEARVTRRRHIQHRTVFTPQQRAALEDVFRKTMYPDNNTILALISISGLNVSAVKTWFKNQRVRWKQQQRKAQSSQLPEETSEMVPVREEETPLLPTAPPMSAGCSDAHGSASPTQSGRTHACVGSSSLHSQTHDAQQRSLESLNPRWTTNPYDIDELVKIYALPGDDDPSSLDQYLFPERSRPDLQHTF